MDNITATVETVMPSTAKRYLADNTNNPRSKSPDRIRRYARDIEAGAWIDGVAVISFDSNGVMLNGQNTCSGVLTSGLPIKAVVVRGLPPEAARVYDTGKARSPKEAFIHYGVPERHAYVAATTCGFILKMEAGRKKFEGGETGSNGELLDTWVRYHELAHIVGRSLDIGPSRGARGGFAAGEIAITWWRLHQIHDGLAADFFRELADPESQSLPIVQARAAAAAVDGLRTNRDSDSRNKTLLHVVLLKAWNHWVQNEPCGSFDIKALGEENLKSFPPSAPGEIARSLSERGAS